MAEDPSLPPCFLYHAGIARDPISTKKGAFKKAFQAHKREKWRRADRLFTKSIDNITGKAIAIFQPPHGKEIPNERIQTFLSRYVLVKHPVVLVGEADFRFAPEIVLATAEARCKNGDSKGALSILSKSRRQDHLHIPLAKAVVSLAEGQPNQALKELEDSIHGDRWRGRLVRAQALVALRRTEEAQREVEAALNHCTGPRQCNLVVRVQQALFPPQKEGAP
jgi:hypothetical protein